jgi:nuclease HARBI1
MSAKSMGRAVKEVSIAIARMKNDYIAMPSSTEELKNNFRMFYEIGKFPTVLGTIDCTHVKVAGQGGDTGEIYRNRKQFFSINVQSVANADLSFQNIVARWPGSTHDSHIFNQSTLKTRLENGEFRNGVLLGDGGYKLFPYLMTPFRDPKTEDEIKYASEKKTRCLRRTLISNELSNKRLCK